jgi:hypothetical protein
MMRVCCVVLLAALTAPFRSAAAEPGPFLEIFAGMGLSSSDWSGAPGGGTGVYARVEYLPWRDSWFTPKVYSGMLFTRPDGDCGLGVTPCDVSSRIGFLGGAARLMAPVPYFGPFVELGVGASVGQMATRSGPAADLRWSGVTYHVPWAVGVAFGSRHEYEVALQYLVHPDQHQTSGAVALGFGFQL